MLDLNALLQSLKEGTCIVEYEKVDEAHKGSIRAMACTLDPERIPTHNTVEQNANTEQLLVWCTDRSAWRSVFVNTIKNWRTANDAGT